MRRANGALTISAITVSSEQVTETSPVEESTTPSPDDSHRDEQPTNYFIRELSSRSHETPSRPWLPVTTWPTTVPVG